VGVVVELMSGRRTRVAGGGIGALLGLVVAVLLFPRGSDLTHEAESLVPPGFVIVDSVVIPWVPAHGQERAVVSARGSADLPPNRDALTESLTTNGWTAEVVDEGPGGATLAGSKGLLETTASILWGLPGDALPTEVGTTVQRTSGWVVLAYALWIAVGTLVGLGVGALIHRWTRHLERSAMPDAADDHEEMSMFTRTAGARSVAKYRRRPA
jgi:hypothetical protein